MPKGIFKGFDLEGLQYIIDEQFGAGAKVDLVIGLYNPLTDDQVSMFEQFLRESSVPLLAPVQYGSSPENGWDYALSIKFHNPVRQPGQVGFVWWIPLALVGGLATIGITGWIGFQVGEFLQSLAKAIIPIALILGGAYLASKALEQRRV